MKITCLLLVFLSLLFWSCHHQKGGDHAVAIKADTSVIRIKWLAQWYGEGKKETLIREIAREYSFLHQDIEIELEFPHEMARIDPDEIAFPYTQDTIVKMARQNQWPYDLMLCDYSLYERVGEVLMDKEWGRKYLVDFGDKEWYINAHKKGFFDTNRYTEVYSDIAPGAYIEGAWNIIYASEVVEKKLGITVKSYDMTMSDFLSYARAVHQYNQTHEEKLTFFSFPQGNIIPFFTQIVMSSLGKETPENSDEAYISLAEAYKALEQMAPYKPLEQYVEYKNVRDLIHERVLFTFSASWINLFWQKTNPEGEAMMHPCEMPSINNKQAFAYSGRYNCVFVVPKNARHREAAEKLMQFISSEETAGKWIKYSKCPTGLRNQISYSDFGTDKYTNFNRHISRKYHDRLTMTDISRTFFQAKTTLNFMVPEVMSGKITAAQAMEDIRRQVYWDRKSS